MTSLFRYLVKLMYGTYVCARNVLTNTRLSLYKNTRTIVAKRRQKPVIKQSILLAQKDAPFRILKRTQRAPDGIVCHGEDAMRCHFGILAGSGIQACLSRKVRISPFVPKCTPWVVLIPMDWDRDVIQNLLTVGVVIMK